MVLIPEEMYENLSKPKPVGPNIDGECEPTDLPSHSAGPPEVRVYGLETEEDKKLLTLAELLPKNLRSRARLLLHYINGKVQLDANSHIIYEVKQPGVRKVVTITGSHLYDCIRYFVSPHNPQFPVKPPEDAVYFALLLQQIGVPSQAISRDISDLSNLLPLEKKSVATFRRR
jgi:hypothetical protein